MLPWYAFLGHVAAAAAVKNACEALASVYGFCPTLGSFTKRTYEPGHGTCVQVILPWLGTIVPANTFTH